MSAPRLRRSIALVVSLLVGVACGDYSRSTSPPQVPQKLAPPTLVVTSPFTVVPHGSMAQVVKWGSAHQNVDETVSAVIGSDGGALLLPGADFSMTIPPGALIKPTRITVTARAGTYVVYDMLPHGLKFSQPVTAVQGLGTTASYGTAAGNSVRTAYLPEGRSQIRRDDFAAPSELQRATTYYYGADPVAETHVWILTHFSRYILISGVWTEVDDDYTGAGGDGGDGGGSGVDGGEQAVESIGAGNAPLSLPADWLLPDTTEGPNAP